MASASAGVRKKLFICKKWLSLNGDGAGSGSLPCLRELGDEKKKGLNKKVI